MKVNIETGFDWIAIGCPQFEGLLWHNTETKEYKHNGEIIEKSDERLVAYLKMCRKMKPINLFEK